MVLPILKYCARCIWWPGFVPIRVSCRCVIVVMWLQGLSMLYKVNSNSNHRLFSELPFTSTRVRHTRAAAAAPPLEFEVSRCKTSKFARSFLSAQVRLWNDLPYTTFDTGTLDGFKSAVNSLLHHWVAFSSVFRGAGACGVAKAIINNFDFFTQSCAAGFNNNNNRSTLVESCSAIGKSNRAPIRSTLSLGISVILRNILR